MGVQSPSTLPSERTDPLKAHQTTIFSWKGFRMNPSNSSESVSWWLQRKCDTITQSAKTMYSPDGKWVWNGTEWISTENMQPPPPPPPPPPTPPLPLKVQDTAPSPHSSNHGLPADSKNLKLIKSDSIISDLEFPYSILGEFFLGNFSEEKVIYDTYVVMIEDVVIDSNGIRKPKMPIQDLKSYIVSCGFEIVGDSDFTKVDDATPIFHSTCFIKKGWHTLLLVVASNPNKNINAICLLPIELLDTRGALQVLTIHFIGRILPFGILLKLIGLGSLGKAKINATKRVWKKNKKAIFVSSVVKVIERHINSLE